MRSNGIEVTLEGRSLTGFRFNQCQNAEVAAVNPQLNRPQVAGLDLPRLLVTTDLTPSYLPAPWATLL